MSRTVILDQALFYLALLLAVTAPKSHGFPFVLEAFGLYFVARGQMEIDGMGGA